MELWIAVGVCGLLLAVLATMRSELRDGMRQREVEADEAEAAGDLDKAADLRAQIAEARKTVGWD